MSAAFDVCFIPLNGDEAAAERIATYLEDVYSLRVWLPKWCMIPGQSQQEALIKGISEARTCAVFVGENTPEGWLRQQHDLALAQLNRDPDFRLIPVLLPNARREHINDLLNLRTPVDFAKGLDDPQALHRLLSGIRGVAPGRGPDDGEPFKEESFVWTRKKLQQIQQLCREQLLEDDVALDCQRKAVARLFDPRGD